MGRTLESWPGQCPHSRRERDTIDELQLNRRALNVDGWNETRRWEVFGTLYYAGGGLSVCQGSGLKWACVLLVVA